MPKYLAAALLLACVAAALGDSIDVELRMPAGVPVSGEDAYVCTTVQLPDRPYKLTGVEPLARQETVHHMLLFGELGVVQQEGGHRAAPQQAVLLHYCAITDASHTFVFRRCTAGCDTPHAKPQPGEPAPAWNCKAAPACGGYSETILYGWGRNASRLELPEGVGFSVGKGSAVAWVVMQVHYLAQKPADDRSGVRLR